MIYISILIIQSPSNPYRYLTTRVGVGFHDGDSRSTTGGTPEGFGQARGAVWRASDVTNALDNLTVPWIICYDRIEFRLIWIIYCEIFRLMVLNLKWM